MKLPQIYMLQFINDLPAHVVGIHATGIVKREEIENVLIPYFDSMVKTQGEINYLLILETDVKNFTTGALLEDIKAGLKHYTKWNKIAVVTDQKSVIKFTNMFRFFIPGKSKGYPLDKLDEAVRWVSARKNNI